MRKWEFLLISALISYPIYSHSQLDLAPGVDRWSIKTSAEKFVSNDHSKAVSLKTLLKLPLLPSTYSTNDYDAILIPKKVGSHHEGDIISTKGYIQLIALERDSKTHKDGDYHIQITMSPIWGDSCFIVELPLPDFIPDPTLKALCQKNRDFIKKKMLKNKEPSSSGNVAQSEIYVEVTGQLFYDAIHAAQMSNPNPKKRKFRGKKGMHSYTAWEIHPITNIIFAVKPHH